MAGPFDVQIPGWLQTRAVRTEDPGWGNTLGTALAGGVRALTEREPDGGAKNFFNAYQEARAAQQDPMWDLKAKHLQAQTKSLETFASAKWMEADRKIKQLDWMQQSMEVTKDWTPKDPIPVGLEPRVSNSLVAIKRQFDMAENQRVNNADHRDFLARKNKLSPELRANVEEVVKTGDGSLTGKSYGMLGAMELIEDNRKKMAVTLAETEAEIRGDRETTTIRGDKVTTKFTPPPSSQTTFNALEEQTIGGVTYVHTSPNTWHRKDKPESQLSVNSLLSQFRQAVANNDSDQIARIQTFAAQNFPNQATLFGVTNAPSAVVPVTTEVPSVSTPVIQSGRFKVQRLP